MKHALLIFAGWVLTGCVYVFSPETVTHYDKDCKDVYRQMTLTVEQQRALPGGIFCSGNDCLSMLAVIALITPVSAIVSSSIVVAGNTVFWIEKQGRCLGKEQIVDAAS